MTNQRVKSIGISSGVFREIKTLNYLKTSETNEFAVAANMVDGLIEYDNYGVVQPGLAKEWSANEDATVWTFKLRDDAKWVTHEGKEYADVVAQDFVDGLHYVLDAKMNRRQLGLRRW